MSSETTVKSTVGIGPRSEGGFGLGFCTEICTLDVTGAVARGIDLISRVDAMRDKKCFTGSKEQVPVINSFLDICTSCQVV